jgi:uncharacterized protein
MREAARLTAPRGPVDTQASPHAHWRTLALDDVGLDPATFWAQRQAPIRSRGLRHGFRMLQEWGNLDNLRLAAGVTDVYLETGEQALLQAVGRQWRDMVDRKLYITGGAGARHEGEAFGHPYELPNDRAYCETCAAIASIMWSWRMLLATGDGQYADLIERTLFNGFLSGISLDGERYFYVNPLLSDSLGEVIGRGGHERRPWYLVACCPPNVMRLLGSVGQHLVTQDEAGIQVHQYFGGSVATDDVELSLTTEYPWSGSIALTVRRTSAKPWTLSLRRPAWCTAAHVAWNGSDASPKLVDGYLQVERSWQPGDRVELTLDMPVRLTRAHPRVEACAGQVAIERGPIVYCFEQCDHADADVLDIALDATAPLEARWQSDLLDGVSVVDAHGFVNAQPAPLYMPSDVPISPRRTTPLRAVPYYAWSNRTPGAMRVWTPIV